MIDHGERLGNMVRILREDAQLTLRDLAEATGCDYTYLSKIENNRCPSPPSDALLAAIERATEGETGRLLGLRAVWIASELPMRVLEAAASRYAQIANTEGKSAA